MTYFIFTYNVDDSLSEVCNLRGNMYSFASIILQSLSLSLSLPDKLQKIFLEHSISSQLISSPSTKVELSTAESVDTLTSWPFATFEIGGSGVILLHSAETQLFLRNGFTKQSRSGILLRITLQSLSLGIFSPSWNGYL